MLDVINLITADLVATGIVGRALGVGARVPDFACSDSQGNTVRLSDVITNRPRIIVVYRGIRCPYFNLELRTYQNALPRLREFKPCTRQRLGNDLPKPIGDESLSLPLSVTYLIGRDGVIAYAFVNAEYRVWTVPEEVFSVLKGTTN